MISSPPAASPKLERQHLARLGDKLVEQADGVAQRAGRLPGDKLQRLRLGLNALMRDNQVQPLDDLPQCDAPEVKPLTARWDRLWHLVNLGGGQHKDGMCGWFFNGLEQRVERRAGEAMHLVNDVHLVLALVGRKSDALTQLAHVIDAGVRRGIDLDQVEEAALVDGLAVAAFIAGAHGRVVVQAVDGLGQQAGHRRLASAARPGEKVSVPHAPADQRIAQCVGHVLLPHDIFKCHRAPA
jgi:hypothetical protein